MGPGSRCLIVQVVAEIRADHDQGVRPQQPFEHPAHFAVVGFPHDQRHQLEVVQHGLQEGQLHFQRVFLGEGQVQGLDGRVIGYLLHGVAVHGDKPQRRLEAVRTAGGDAGEGHPV
jgi:hypothetical protein